MNRSTHESIRSEIPRGYAQRPALLLHKLGMEVLERAEDPLAALGLSGREYSLLAILESDQPESQLELALLCGLMPAQVGPVLDELEKRGLAERRRSETDRRRSVVRLTDDGRELLAQADALGRQIEDVLFGHLEPAARAELGETLRIALERALGA
jgi:DNA-binding MarR family transcriptional regulator